MIAPSSLKYVKLKDYQKFSLIENPSNEDLIKCITGINSLDLAKLKAVKVDNLTNELSKLFDVESKFISEFTIYGITYGFIPKLDDITYGENKDITSYINDWGNMHKAMAVLYRPIKKKYGSKYLIEDYEGSHVYSEVMKDMPLNVVMGAMVFFYNLTNVLLNSIPRYLESQTKEIQTITADSEKNGQDIQSCIAYLNQTLQSLKKLQDSPFISV